MSFDEVRRITDSRVLAAMAHPLRRRLMDVLKVHGPSTATSLAATTGQAIGNVSHHLRVLGDCGLLEEAPELARDRRERWWRLVSRGIQWSSGDFRDDPATAAVADAAESLNLDHHVQQVRSWFAAGDEERAVWRDRTFAMDNWLQLTPDELRQLGEEINDVLERWRRKPAPHDGQERQTVFVFSYGVPGQP
ncbi:ArsR/SmtB family transcription factor [Couchioplanes caeruleus]|uniref:Transcriptional regulator n=2 Tax=Couchioplanes caeruleus TaxID=56438 RepID=A0A1K0GUG1_9ACTN|nr:helix-turn-helix domain-containing protein [Couchioplanes caeruleus]OJF14948.1 transcriptional regulator [Couchioplanes caeruleus subsp. caeruleus]ROP30447.1 ArsR family transcriptional regulator [Couchioplanes caeruleus]